MTLKKLNLPLRNPVFLVLLRMVQDISLPLPHSPTPMPDISSYIQYLPPILWSEENDASQFLGRMLRIYEKILTGIDDEIAISNGVSQYQPLENTLDNLAQIFNTWQTPPEFLPWLASWVALPLQNDWSEYQKRKIISQIVSIYQLRGLKKGLHTYLDLYTSTKAKPRIVIDEGEAVFRASFLLDGMVGLYAIAHSNTVSLPATLDGRAASKVTVLLHPSAIAVDSNNNYIIADAGGEVEASPPTLWKMSSNGDIDYQAATPIPLPKPIYSGDLLKVPTAVTVDNQDRCSILDIGTTTSTSNFSSIYRFTPPAYTVSIIISQSTNPTFPALHPVDMALDASSRFIVLDRGGRTAGFPPQGNTAPKIVIVSENPLAVTVQALTTVVEPTAIAIDSQGRYIVADAKEPRSASDPLNRPADLIRVDPSANWSETSLLASVPADKNPLIFPTDVVFETPESLLVCDTGVRWRFVGDRSNRAMAEPPGIYRVDLSQTPPTITRLTEEKRLVNPSKMTFDRKGKLIITDRGEALRLRTDLKREWRTRPNEFGVTVLFSQQRPTPTDERNRIRRGIVNVVEGQKPGHTSWWLEF
jgi:phage tail-like protein